MRRSSVLASALVIAAAVTGGAQVAFAADQVVAKPRFSHTKADWQHFVTDTLPDVVEGATFDWDGRTYEVVKLHSITRSSTTRWAPARRNEEVVHRGYVFAVVHVKVDGRLIRANIEGTANYVTFPQGWEWDRVLLYLGRNVSYEFVEGVIE